MKGIILAGGTGSRLWPITKVISKQLLPVYDKPMIYYPISTLMLAGIREILIITTPHDQLAFVNLLGDGTTLGIRITYALQHEPRGLADAFIVGEEFLEGSSCLMILGDNIFHGAGLGKDLVHSLPESGAHIFIYEVSNPSDYGILEIDYKNRPISITEKPTRYISNLAITGLYYFDNSVVEIAKNVVPSGRGEIEITSVLENYLTNDHLTFTRLSRGTAWLDTGKPNSMHDASTFIRVIEERTGLKIACLEEISLANDWINEEEVLRIADEMGGGGYAQYLRTLIKG